MEEKIKDDCGIKKEHRSRRQEVLDSNLRSKWNSFAKKKKKKKNKFNLKSEKFVIFLKCNLVHISIYIYRFDICAITSISHFANYFFTCNRFSNVNYLGKMSNMGT